QPFAVEHEQFAECLPVVAAEAFKQGGGSLLHTHSKTSPHYLNTVRRVCARHCDTSPKRERGTPVPSLTLRACRKKCESVSPIGRSSPTTTCSSSTTTSPRPSAT